MSALLSEASARDAILAAIDAQRGALTSELGSESGKLKRGRVHRLRVATRRLLAALDLASALGAIVPRALLRRLKELLDDLSPLRDAQVMVRELEQLPPDEVEESILRRVKRRAKKRRERASRRLARFDRDELQADLTTVSASAVRPEALSLASLGALSLSGALARQLLAIEVLRAAARSGTPHELHHLRLALKAYRYTLEILSGQLSSPADELIAATARLQDELGEAHDRQVLAELVARHAASDGRDSSRRLAEALAQRSREVHARAAESAQQMQLGWPFGDAPSGELNHMKSAP